MECFYFLSEPPLAFDLQCHKLKGYVKVRFIVVLHGLCLVSFIPSTVTAFMQASAVPR